MRTSVVIVVFLCVARTVYGDCDRPQKGPNMELITDVTFPAPEGTSVTFTCEVGYRKVGGSGTVVCSGGKWSSTNMRCEIINCGSAGEVLNGRVDYSEGTEFGAIARVVCNEGYVVVGIENQVVCGVNGWQGRLASCEVIKCDRPNSIVNGVFNPDKDDYEHSEVITYSCNGDYILNGSRSSTCQESGQFHPAPPKCVLVNCPDPLVDNGVAAAGSRPPYKHGSSVTFKCKTGFSMVGQGTVSCDINSKWSPVLPKCNPIECKAPEISNGEVVNPTGQTYKYGETISLKCTEGYRLDGTSTLTCGEGNQWSAPIPVCTLIQCQAPHVEGGVLVGDSRPSYKYKDSVSFKCNTGYTLSGESTLTCGENSQWSPELPKCTLIQCQAPHVEGGVLVESRPPYKYKDSVSFKCNTGYDLSGESTVTCGDNSQWSPELPKCTLVACRAPEVTFGEVVEGSRPSYKYKDSVRFQCKSGYALSGESTLTCAANSQWSPDLPQCIPKSHGHTKEIVGGVIGVLLAIGIGFCIFFGLMKKKKGERGFPVAPA